MPAEAYTKGFLRMYAEFLGLNGTLYVDEYNERIAPHDDEPFVPESLAPAKRRHRVLFRTILGVVGVAAAVAALNLFGSGGTAATHVANAAPPEQPTRLVLPAAVPAVQPAEHVQAKPTVALIRAVTSRSWLSVRLGNANGKEVFRGFLEPGSSALLRPPAERLAPHRPPAGRSRSASARTSSAACPATPANLLLTRDGPRAG